MDVAIEMTLPREAESAPLVRRTLDASLCGLGVGADVRADIALALGEACANVIQHAESSRDYEVRARLDGARFVVDIIDGGREAVPADWEEGEALPLAEHGRGLTLIRAFTEGLSIRDRRDASGAVVHFEKTLVG
ncbi:ATP-binding protein [Spirillospora sp. CA-294931]|uniref:ATP-binding protein n=1 Tax=Spirillospora sp. CA-294931 TaxID=3240042 RepID=UPI003D8D6676